MTEIITETPLEVSDLSETDGKSNGSRLLAIGGVILLLLLVVGVIASAVLMVRNPDQTETIRDIVIIFMAVEFLLIGLVLIILIIQLARLTTMLQDEVKPILDSTNETIGNLRGTTAFLSDTMVKPVIKVNSTISAMRRAVDLLRPRRSRER
jgi:hypothetical protein